jgi:hypothetical protein
MLDHNIRPNNPCAGHRDSYNHSMTTTNWLNPNDKKIEMPAKIRAWAENQMVTILNVNEVLCRWMRFDGETLVVRN